MESLAEFERSTFEGIFSPHSLGKLIEWKECVLHPRHSIFKDFHSPHSPGKLIEWKGGTGEAAVAGDEDASPLAGETN